MKVALIASWALFAVLFASRSGADDYIVKDGNGVLQTFEVTPGRSGTLATMKMNAHLDDADIEHIREACR